MSNQAEMALAVAVVLDDQAFPDDQISGIFDYLGSHGHATPIVPRSSFSEMDYTEESVYGLPDLIKLIRRRMGISQAKMAVVLQVHWGTMNRIETGAQTGMNQESKSILRDLVARQFPDLMDMYRHIQWPTKGRKSATW